MKGQMDRDAFNQLVLDQLPQLQRFAIRLTGDHPDLAEEVVQEALVRASRSWNTFRSQSKFTTWMMRIVINCFRDMAGTDNMGGPLPDDMPDARSIDPKAVMSQQELDREVARCVSELPARQREVLVLHVYEGLTAAEVAEALGTSQQNVRTNLHYARRRLRGLLSDYLRDSDR